MSSIVNHASINLRRLEENRHKKLIEYQHVKYKRILRKRIQMVLVPQKRTQMVLEVTIQLRTSFGIAASVWHGFSVDIENNA